MGCTMRRGFPLVPIPLHGRWLLGRSRAGSGLAAAPLVGRRWPGVGGVSSSCRQPCWQGINRRDEQSWMNLQAIHLHIKKNEPSFPPGLRRVDPCCPLQRALGNVHGSSCVAVVTPFHDFLKKILIQSTSLSPCVLICLLLSSFPPLSPRSLLNQLAMSTTLNTGLQKVLLLDSWEVSASFWKTGSLVEQKDLGCSCRRQSLGPY